MNKFYSTTLLAILALGTTVNAQKSDRTGFHRAGGTTPERMAELRDHARPDWLDAARGGGLPNDDCAGAVSLAVGATCAPTSANFDGATESMPAITCNNFTATAANDLWYSFTATGASTTIQVTGGPEIDPIIEAFTGACGGLTSAGCADATLVEEVESIILPTTAGQTYYFRTYWWPYDVAPVDFSFSVCVFSTPAAPPNDECTGTTAQALSVGGSITASGSSVGALDTEGLGLNTVWEAFTITTCADVKVSYCGSTEGSNPGITALSSDCPPVTIVGMNGGDVTTCSDGHFTACFRNLAPGTYYVPVAGDVPSYVMTVTATACLTGTAVNDDCAQATPLTVYDFCNPHFSSSELATESMPAATCSGFTGAANDDVWFSFVATTTDMTVAATGDATFDGVLEAFEGACGSLTTIGTCADATLAGETEIVELTGLTVGNTYYARVYSFGAAIGCTNGLSICVVEGIGISIGVKENDFGNWSVFPNPGNGDFTLTNAGVSGVLDLDVYDVNGRLVHNERTVLAKGGQYVLALSGKLAAGSYTLRIAGEQGVAVQRLTVR